MREGVPQQMESFGHPRLNMHCALHIIRGSENLQHCKINQSLLKPQLQFVTLFRKTANGLVSFEKISTTLAVTTYNGPHKKHYTYEAYAHILHTFSNNN